MRLARVGLVVGLAAAGAVAATVGAHGIVDAQSRGSAVWLGVLAALCYFLASVVLAPLIGAASLFWRLMHWLSVFILATIVLAAVGFIQVGWTQHRPVYVRIASDGLIAVAAAVGAALPGLLSAIVVSSGLRSAARGLGSRAGFARYGERLEAHRALWSPPPLRRLAALLTRCLAMCLLGTILSVAGQAVAYAASASTRMADLIVPALGWVVGCALGWAAAGRVIGFTPSRHRSRDVVHGLAIAWLSVAVMIAVYANQAADTATSRLVRHDRSLTYAPHVTVSIGLSGKALAEALEPDFYFSAGERWHPTSVDWFVHAAKLTPHAQLTGADAINGHVCQPACYVLPCTDLDGACTDGAPQAPLVYALLRSVSPGTLPGPFAAVTRIVQYWLFYNFDAFPRALISQWHQGDWEQITVGVAGTHPSFVGYSEHCFGTWLRWRDVPVHDSTHPSVFVGEGTHANYPRSFEAPLRGSHCLDAKPPRYLAAGGLGFGLIGTGGRMEVPGDYAFEEVDRVGDDHLRPPVAVVAAKGAIAAFKGTWGLDNRLSLGRGGARIQGGAPASPAAHPEWTSPAAAILCNPKWFTEQRLRCDRSGG